MAHRTFFEKCILQGEMYTNVVQVISRHGKNHIMSNDTFNAPVSPKNIPE